jgi:hypothetical protein
LRAAQLNTYNGGICATETTTGVVTAAISSIDTGISAAQGWAFITGNNSGIAERMRIDSSGRVGIGTTTVSSNLHIKPTTGDDSVFTNGLRVERNDTSGQYGLFNYAGGAASITAVETTASNPVVRFLRSTNGSTTTETARFDASGRLLVGTSTSISTANGFTPSIQAAGTSALAAISIGRYVNSASAGQLQVQKSRSGTIGSHSIVSNNDDVGQITFEGSDGTNFIQAAIITAAVDGTPGANDMPGRLVFSTTADGASTPTERMRIGRNGFTKCAGNSTLHDASGLYHEFISNTDVSGPIIFCRQRAGAGSQRGIDVYYDAVLNSANNAFFTGQDSGATRIQLYSNGGIANFSANDVNLSDRNVKKDISPTGGTWECLKEWEIVRFRYKDQPDNAEFNIGVIAQQIAESCPEVVTVFQEAREVTGDLPAQEERIGVKEQQMYWMAIKALQEAQARIETLEQRLNDAGIN